MTTLAPILDLLKPGMRVFAAGSAGEPVDFLEAIAADPERFHDLDIVTSAVPGINRFDYSSLTAANRLTGLFMLPGLAEAQRVGRFRQLTASYAGFVQWLEDRSPAFDLTVAQVAAPSSAGQCSMGFAVEFLPTVLSRSKLVAALVNERMPDFPGAPSVEFATCAAAALVDRPLSTYETGNIEDVSKRIASHLAPLIDDGACIQAGLGKVPAALLGLLTDRRGLRIHSGMLSDGVRLLSEAGALAKNSRPTGCVLIGSPGFHDWACERDDLVLRGCDWTHSPMTLAGLEAFFAINSAIEVDLSGQAALEHVDAAAISGAGGAPDFAHAARRSPGGASIIALPSTAKRGGESRIVTRLSAPSVVSVGRTDVDVVVTEYGAADLRGCSIFERAERLIEVAHPDYRSTLDSEWRKTACKI